MIELHLALQVVFSFDIANSVQVAVDNAAAIKDLAAAYYLYRKASHCLRKEPKSK